MSDMRQRILPVLVLPSMEFLVLIQIGSIILASFLSHFFEIGWCVLFLFLISFFFCFKPLGGDKKFIFVLAIILGAWSYFTMAQVDATSIGENHVSRFCNFEKYKISGRISSFCRHYSGKVQVILDHISLIPEVPDNLEKIVLVKGKILCNIYRAENFSGVYGDRLEFTGKLKAIRNFANPNGFDYQQFLSRKDIWGSTYTSKGKFILSFNPSPGLVQKILASFERHRNSFFFHIQKILENSESSAVLAALVTGKKNLISHSLRDDFSRVGVAHLLAISGVHMSILATGSWWIFFLLFSFSGKALISGKAKKIAGIFTLFPLLAYAVFAGFSPSTQRAFFMTFVFMVSILADRDNIPVNTLAFAGVIILAFDPCALFSISFQLSFTSVLFIIVGLEILQRKAWLKGRSKWLSFFAKACMVTLLAGLGTAPLVIRYFNVFSFVQVLSNLILLPLVGMLCLPLGLFSLILFIVHSSLADVLILFCGKLLDASIALVEYLASLPFSWTCVFSLSLWEVVLLYSLMGCGLLYLSGKKYRKKLWISSLGLVVLVLLDGVYVFRTYFFPDNLSVVALDVGQGNSVLIRTPSGNRILVDGGGFPNYGNKNSGFDVGRYIVGPYLWGQKIMSLDAVIISHPEADHINGLVFILENFKVGKLIKNSDKNTNLAYESVMRLCKENKIPVIIPGCQHLMESFSDTTLKFFECEGKIIKGALNDNSLVFQLQYKDFTMLFPGDIMARREKHLALSKGNIMASQILLCPHHGSASSSKQVFLEKVIPEVVIISCGYANRYKFPRPEILERYQKKQINIFRTDIDGAVTIMSDGHNYSISTGYSDVSGI